MKKSTLLLILFLLAGCQIKPTATVPTLAVLPTLTPSATDLPTSVPPTATLSTETPTMTDTPTVPPSDTPSDTLTPSPTDTSVPSATPTLTPSDIPSDTPTPTPSVTFTPSLTITNTITPTASPSFTASPELDSLGMLALLSERATILPPEVRYNPPTLTAVAVAAQTLIAIGAGLTPSPAPVLPTQPGVPQLATLPPPITSVCTVPPPGSLGTAFAGDPSLTQAVGCPQGAVFTATTAVEAFEHGSMLYLAGSPSSIYVLTLDGRFRRFDDTWVSSVDPELGGETPPLGLLEPKRGFGKVWRSNLDVRGSLGWAVTDEQGASSPLQMFDRGRAIFLPQRGEIELLIDDPGGQAGSWRSLPGGF